MFRIAILEDVTPRELSSIVVALAFWATLLAEIVEKGDNTDDLVYFMFTQATISIAVYIVWLKYGRTSGPLSLSLAALFFSSEAAFLVSAGVLAGDGSTTGITVATLKGIQIVIENTFQSKQSTSGMYLPMYNELANAL